MERLRSGEHTRQTAQCGPALVLFRLACGGRRPRRPHLGLFFNSYCISVCLLGTKNARLSRIHAVGSATVSVALAGVPPASRMPWMIHHSVSIGKSPRFSARRRKQPSRRPRSPKGTVWLRLRRGFRMPARQLRLPQVYSCLARNGIRPLHQARNTLKTGRWTYSRAKAAQPRATKWRRPAPSESFCRHGCSTG